MGYTMTADEVAYWQDQAALLDPDAYEWVSGNSLTRTVGAGERWYLVNAWNVEATGGGTTFFHRPVDVGQAMMIPEGTALTTRSTGGGMYLCKPSLVTGSDARYTDDPRGLYFDRLIRLGTLTLEFIGATVTGSGQTDVSFPGGFAQGMVMHVSAHDVAWLILYDGAGGANTLNEISDADRIRFAEAVMVPFNVSDFEGVLIQGVSESEGRATLHYVELPGDW